MTLTSALNTAKSSLASSQTQMALVSRNIANVNTEGATRKYANVVTGSGGRVEVRSIAQSSSSTLYRNMLDSTSSLQQTSVVKDGLSRIDEMIGDIEKGNTPAALIGAFMDKLKAYASSPQSFDMARSAASAAQDIVSALNQGTETIDVIRRDADDALSDAATDMTKILANIEDLNRQVVSGTIANRDVTDLVDERDKAVAQLSQYVGINAQTRGDNDLVLYTDSGVTLFDKVAREVSFSTTHPLVDGQAGNGFRIDGTLVTGDNAMMPVKSGKIAGLVQLRDDIAVTYQTQLDEMARGLVAATAEGDNSGTDVPGLFTAVDPTTLTVKSSAAVGAFSAANLPGAGDTLSFTLTLGGKSYAVSGSISPTPSTAAGYASALQGLIQNAVPVGGTGTLGAGHVTVTADAAGNLTVAANDVGGKLPLAISAVANATTPGKTGGLTAGTASATESPIYGLARQLRVAAAVASDPTTIRDGVAVDVNPTNLAGFTTRLSALNDAFSATRGFASGTDALGSGSLTEFATSSVSWLQEKRSDAIAAAEYKQTLLDRTKETLSNETGINLNDEYLSMTNLERSFQASSKILTTIDEMIKALLNAI